MGMGMMATVYNQETNDHGGDIELAAVPIPGTDLGALVLQQLSASTATRTSVAGVASGNVAIVPANPGRFGLSLQNETVATLYVALGAASSGSGDYSYSVAPGASWTLPLPFTGTIFGSFSADASAGSVKVTELTA